MKTLRWAYVTQMRRSTSSKSRRQQIRRFLGDTVATLSDYGHTNENNGRYFGFGEAVRVHGGQQEDVGGVEEAADALVAALLDGQVLDELQDHLAADDFVAVDVADQFHHGHEEVAPTAADGAAHLDDPEIAAGHRFADRRQPDQLRVTAFHGLQPPRHLVVAQVAIRRHRIDAGVGVGRRRQRRRRRRRQQQHHGAEQRRTRRVGRHGRRGRLGRCRTSKRTVARAVRPATDAGDASSRPPDLEGGRLYWPPRRRPTAPPLPTSFRSPSRPVHDLERFVDSGVPFLLFLSHLPPPQVFFFQGKGRRFTIQHNDRLATRRSR